jgi:hypothetical protein
MSSYYNGAQERESDPNDTGPLQLPSKRELLEEWLEKRFARDNTASWLTIAEAVEERTRAEMAALAEGSNVDVVGRLMQKVADETECRMRSSIDRESELRLAAERRIAEWQQANMRIKEQLSRSLSLLSRCEVGYRNLVDFHLIPDTHIPDAMVEVELIAQTIREIE